MKVVCLGDSFTVGPGVNSQNHWLCKLQEHFTSYEFVNRGLNGDTTSGMLARLRHDVIEDAPSYAIIIGGTNDLICQGTSPGIMLLEELSFKGDSIAPTIKSNYMAMVHHLFTAGIKPIIASPLPCISSMIPSEWASFYDFSCLNEDLNELNVWQRKFARSFMCSSLDIFDPFLQEIDRRAEGAQDLYLDGLHLSAEGHGVVADLLIGQLDGILR